MLYSFMLSKLKRKRNQIHTWEMNLKQKKYFQGHSAIIFTKVFYFIDTIANLLVFTRK